jgi:RNA-directed DNA polymerase
LTGPLLNRISKDLLLPIGHLDYLIRSAPYRYKTYEVPKRTSGTRTIAQPAEEVKRLQYWVIQNIFPSMPIHSAATAYVAGNNIGKNCEPHAIHPYMLKLDFTNFFPSIKGPDFLMYANDNLQLSVEETDFERLMKVLFWRPKGQRELQLSIGAPSSPHLSNAMMFVFDTEMSKFCQERNVKYTRYADDMTFSMDEKELRGQVLQRVLAVLKELPFPRLEINTRKTVFGSKAHRRMITGLILSNDGSVSLGRERKRRIRAQLHYLIHGKLTEKDRAVVRGMLAFAKDIEPGFFERMVRKYGAELISQIKAPGKH